MDYEKVNKMAYEKQNWQCGDVVTAEKLNHMEDGIANSGGVAPLILQGVEEGNDVRLDKTFGEIKSAFNSGKTTWLAETVSTTDVSYHALKIIAVFGSTGGSVGFGDFTFSADSDEDYPKMS